MPQKKPATKPAKKPSPPRVRGVKRAPMKKTFIGNFLDKGKKPRRKLKTNTEVSRYILALALDDLDGAPITGPSPEGDEKIARMMASEIAAAVDRQGSKSARGWYTDAIRRTIRLAGMMHEEILDDEVAASTGPACIRSAADARTVLTAAMAITSQSVPVNENMRYALEQYRFFLAHGRFHPKGYGVKGSSILLNLKRFNHMLEASDNDIGALRDFLSAQFSMREIKEAGAKFGIQITSKEMMDEPVTGSVVFGPKIGSFYQNLNANFSPLTMDLWFCRTWGRYTGTLVRDDVSPAQVERLVETLRADVLNFAEIMREEGIEMNPDTLEDAESEDLQRLCRSIHKFWENRRKGMVEGKFSNAQISIIKSGLGWPGAAESILKSLTGTVDAPSSGGQRRWMRTVMQRALQILKRNGYPMTTADAQAILWYPEKSLYDHLAGRKPGLLTVSYDEAMDAIARKEGFTDAQIEQALHARLSAERGGQRVPGAAGRGEPGAVQGHDRRADGPVEEPPTDEAGYEVGVASEHHDTELADAFAP